MPSSSHQAQSKITCESCDAVWASPVARRMIEQSGECLRCGQPITLPRRNERDGSNR
jgi:uncharacterized paraquat-inducible protein A